MKTPKFLKIALVTLISAAALSLSFGLVACGEKECKHTYDNACDVTCNTCGEERAVEDHIPAEDDGDCTTEVKCSECGETVVSAKAAHTPAEDDGDCTTEVKCTVCGTVTTAARESHTGGVATCVSGKLCDVCETEYDTTLNPDNHDLSKIDENGKCACGETFVAGVGSELYATFAETLTAWTEGTTLTLFSDVKGLTEQIKTTAKGLVLDLNGHALTSSASNAIWIDGASASELTIRDSKGGGYIQGTVYAVAGGSTLRLESGTLSKVFANGNFTMVGGTIRNEEGYGVVINSKVDVVITGGEIYGAQKGIIAYNGNLTVSGTAKIVGVNAAIEGSKETNVTISGTPTISGTDCEIWVNTTITLNTQPTDGKVWRIKNYNPATFEGVIAVPGEGVTLDISKFASAVDGYEVQLNDNGELVFFKVEN